MLRPLARIMRALALKPSKNILLGSISTGVADICINAPERLYRLKRCTVGEDDHIASEQAGLLGRRALYNTGNHAVALHVETREDANAGIGDTATRKSAFQSAPP